MLAGGRFCIHVEGRRNDPGFDRVHLDLAFLHTVTSAYSDVGTHPDSHSAGDFPAAYSIAKPFRERHGHNLLPMELRSHTEAFEASAVRKKTEEVSSASSGKESWATCRIRRCAGLPSDGDVTMLRAPSLASGVSCLFHISSAISRDFFRKSSRR